VGAAKEVLAASLAYAKQRKAFGTNIAEFGAIQHKLAEMAIRTFAVEAMTWRVVGLIGEAHSSTAKLQAVEEFAVECSIVKVYASEAIGFVADEGVQIHGGYGYHKDYAVERIYRDSRIFRIFEGTNEINRVLITGMLLKRASRGRVSLDPENAAGTVQRAALEALRLARETFGETLEQQQEVMMAISGIIMEAFAMESATLRAENLGSKGVIARDMSSVLAVEGMQRVNAAAREVYSACGATWKRLELPAIDTIAARRRIAQKLLGAGRYTL
jgi:alkylation response protein AidB-like acyl-CoA dehydrogenase